MAHWKCEDLQGRDAGENRVGQVQGWKGTGTFSALEGPINEPVPARGSCRLGVLGQADVASINARQGKTGRGDEGRGRHRAVGQQECGFSDFPRRGSVFSFAEARCANKGRGQAAGPITGRVHAIIVRRRSRMKHGRAFTGPHRRRFHGSEGNATFVGAKGDFRHARKGRATVHKPGAELVNRRGAGKNV